MNTNSTSEVCEECIRKTRIRYRYRGGFFTPRLRHINHLQVGRSKIISNPITIFVEYLYVVYKKIRNLWDDLCKWLFPKIRKVSPKRIDSHLVGRVVFGERKEEDIPIHNLKLEFWARRWWLFQWRQLSGGYTDANGYFRLPFHLRSARNWMNYKVQLEIYQVTHIFFKDEAPAPHYERRAKIRITISDLIGMSYNLHTLRLFYWEYAEDTLTPRTVIRNDGKYPPETYSQGRLDAMNQQVIPIELTKIKHLEQIAHARETISIQSIQSDYPENLTVCIEKSHPGYTRGDEWFGMRMMNGMNKGSFMPDPENPGAYLMKYFGICNYDKNDEYAMPTVEIRFRVNDLGIPMPDLLTLTGQLNAFNKDPWQVHRYGPADEPGWSYAKRLARCSGAFCTEVDEHFSFTHLNTEQYAIAAFRNLRLNPVAWLLLPHLKEVSLINHAADSLIINSYLPSATAMTSRGLKKRTRDILGMQDWRGWKPMKPISGRHTYAKAEGLYWDVVSEYVEGFFSQHMHQIIEHWYEIYRFSFELVKNSVPVFLSDIDVDKLPPKEKQLALERFEYYCFQYCFDRTLDRQTIKGELKAVSPISLKPHISETDTEEIANLKYACKYIITLSTFLHMWINEYQYDDLGEVLYSCGGLRFGERETGVLAPEDDLAIAPDLTRSTQMLWFTNLLSRTEYGFITKNEEGDVNPLFIRLLKDKKAEFEKLGVDITAIESRTNI